MLREKERPFHTSKIPDVSPTKGVGSGDRSSSLNRLLCEETDLRDLPSGEN